MNKTFYLNSVLNTKARNKSSNSLKIAGYANTTDKDRAGDVISAEAWAKGVDNYRKNPVLLYQHDHEKPIGKVDQVLVDKKGIFVEASVSNAAEKLHGVQTLINDGALKSFSVGFRVKDADYDRDNDTFNITDVELMEISVVSVPCNQESLFSVRKSFENDNEYESFKEKIKASAMQEETVEKEHTTEKASLVNVGVTNYVSNHYHTVEVDGMGFGVTTYSSHGHKHYHEVKNFQVLEDSMHNDHTHDMVFLVKPSEQSDEHPRMERPSSPSEMEGDAVLNILGPESDETVSTKGEDEMSESETTDTLEITSDEVLVENETKSDDIITEPESEEDLVSDAKSEEDSIITEEGTLMEEEINEEPEISADPYEPIPFVNLLSLENSELSTDDFVKFNDSRWQIVKIATAQNPIFQLLEVDLTGKTLDNTTSIDAKNIAIVNTWDIGTKFDKVLTEFKPKTYTDKDRSEIRGTFNSNVSLTEQELHSLKPHVESDDYKQEILNKTINLLSTPSEEWTDTNYQVADYMNNMIVQLKTITSEVEDDSISRKDLALMLHGHKSNKDNSKENNEMATQNAGDPIVVKTEAEPSVEEEKIEEVKASDTSVAVAAEPRVADLIEKTGEAILSEADAKEQKLDRGEADYTPAETDKVAELTSQLKKYEDQIAAMNRNKMVYQETSHTSKEQFSEKDMANACMLAYALDKRDPFDTKMGQKIKAITSVDAFLSNFSTNVYEEMEQQLVIAPMFDRIQVDARTFRVPVAAEDTDGDVAQFASGTFATGIGDTTNVPTSNQHAISAVEFTPHKFMATTHLAKDEEEDTVLPLMDFLRRAATRRVARAIDKAILRGTGALTGFTAAPTNAITAGAGYASVIKGVSTLADDISGLRSTTGSANDKADATDIASARAKMGKYGLQLGDHLVYVTSVEGYNELVSFSDFRTVDKFGPNATYLTGSVGAIYGIPIVISEFMDNVGSTGNEIGVLIYKPGFLIAERRGMEIESEYEPRQQVTAMYMSTRFDFKALSSNSSAALDATNFAYASLVECG